MKIKNIKNLNGKTIRQDMEIYFSWNEKAFNIWKLNIWKIVPEVVPIPFTFIFDTLSCITSCINNSYIKQIFCSELRPFAWNLSASMTWMELPMGDLNRDWGILMGSGRQALSGYVQHVCGKMDT